MSSSRSHLLFGLVAAWLLLLLLVCCTLPHHGVHAHGTVWPPPRSFTLGDTVIGIDPEQFEIVVEYDKSMLPSSMALLRRAVRRYQNFWMFPFNLTRERQEATVDKASIRQQVDHELMEQMELDKEASDVGIDIDENDPDKQIEIDLLEFDSAESLNRVTLQKYIRRLTVFVHSCPDLTYGVKESYTLDVTHGNDSRLTAETCYGAIRGLESFSQLVAWDHEYVQYVIRSTPLTIIDNPRFHWRGLMLDTAGRYVPVRTIFQILDAMSWAKLNVFHWHLSDDQSFPVLTKSTPYLARGAFSRKQIYTVDMLKLVVAHAKDRGIRVIPEFEMPAHATSWSHGYPRISTYKTCNGSFASFTTFPLDAGADRTYEIIQNLLSELSTTFSDAFVHLGGDMSNAHLECWETRDFILLNKEFAETVRPDDTNDILFYFVNRTNTIVAGLQKHLIKWEDVLEVPGVRMSADSLIQFRTADRLRSYTSTATGQTQRTPFIISNNWDINSNTEWHQLLRINNEFLANNSGALLGGEALAWPNALEAGVSTSILWPRAAAVGAALWSAEFTQIDAAVEQGIERWSCHTLRRGVESSLQSSTYCDLPLEAEPQEAQSADAAEPRKERIPINNDATKQPEQADERAGADGAADQQQRQDPSQRELTLGALGADVVASDQQLDSQVYQVLDVPHLGYELPQRRDDVVAVVHEGAGFWTLLFVFVLALVLGILCGTLFPLDTLMTTIRRLNAFGWAVLLTSSAIATLFLYLLSHSLYSSF